MCDYRPVSQVMGILASDCNYSEVRVDEHDSDQIASVHKGAPCTGNPESSVRTISIAYVQFFVPGNSNLPYGQFQALRALF